MSDLPSKMEFTSVTLVTLVLSLAFVGGCVAAAGLNLVIFVIRLCCENTFFCVMYCANKNFNIDGERPRTRTRPRAWQGVLCFPFFSSHLPFPLFRPCSGGNSPREWVPRADGDGGAAFYTVPPALLWSRLFFTSLSWWEGESSTYIRSRWWWWHPFGRSMPVLLKPWLKWQRKKRIWKCEKLCMIYALRFVCLPPLTIILGWAEEETALVGSTVVTIVSTTSPFKIDVALQERSKELNVENVECWAFCHQIWT